MSSWHYAVNQRMLTCGQALYQLMVALVAAGWTVKGSGDGTFGNFSATGNIITSGNHVAFGLLNVGAWFRIQSPVTGFSGQQREFVFQNGVTSGPISIRIKYSPNVTGSSGGFTGGTPSASEVPSAADQVIVAGSGTDASPTYVSWGGALTDYQFVMHIVCDTGPNGYCWYMMQCGESTNYPNGSSMALDTMVPGTFNPADTDPAVIYWASSGLGGYGSELRAANTWAFVGGISATNWVNVELIGFTSGYYIGNSGTDAWNDEDTAITTQWVRTAVAPPFGTKGYSTLFLYAGQPRGNMYLINLNPNSVGDHVWVNGTLLVWPPNTVVFIA